MKKQEDNPVNESGFTIVEVIVTVVITSLFLFGFFQSYILLESQRVSVARQAVASDIAYSNLRKVTSRTGLDPSTDCDVSGKDLMGTASLGYTHEPNIEKSLGSGATDTLYAYPTAGCSGTSFTDNPIKIVSTVTFSINGRTTEVVHANFIK